MAHSLEKLNTDLGQLPASVCRMNFKVLVVGSQTKVGSFERYFEEQLPLGGVWAWGDGWPYGLIIDAQTHSLAGSRCFADLGLCLFLDELGIYA